jgi:hypothetical protein
MAMTNIRNSDHISFILGNNPLEGPDCIRIVSLLEENAAKCQLDIKAFWIANKTDDFAC